MEALREKSAIRQDGLLQDETLRANTRRAFQRELSSTAKMRRRFYENHTSLTRDKGQIGFKKISVEIERESGQCR